MANTTSGTTVFDKNFAIDEIIEEAYERIGMQGVSGNQLRMARRSLNILFQYIIFPNENSIWYSGILGDEKIAGSFIQKFFLLQS